MCRTPAVASASPVAAPSAVPAETELAPSPDEARIETPRCTTCNECTNINNKMFAYNENKQAYIADLAAGTYSQLVLAAESCPVAIIHPGKPLNPNEPGLEDLLARAEAFR
ncbi:MAG: ferredoxin [Acidobacteria bacterium]|nr:ferredoxin [Acidobacteriota bacterium]